MRNSDRIKQLENLLAHERKQIEELRLRNRGLLQMQMAMDAILYRFAEKYGEERREDDGTLIGWHIAIPKPDLSVSKDQVRIEKSADGTMIYIGVLANEKKDELDTEEGETGEKIRS